MTGFDGLYGAFNRLEILLQLGFYSFNVSLKLQRHVLCDLCFNVLYAWKVVRRTKLVIQGFGLYACPAGEGVNLALIIYRDKAPPITFCQPETMLLQGLLEGWFTV